MLKDKAKADRVKLKLSSSTTVKSTSGKAQKKK
jgi:hypothetical protein